ncbi:hypothetical protein QLS91_09140 [Flavobacterium sp. LB2P84]|uniref:Uncharacterized protein n=1 Tax=Flavobacterium yafengii TaxID=3041253 RepID=A0AAW6TI16_9FLAO|nr:hypothetical protein [Flavobacterium yafengii]MDI5948069.1 hypothetical protein [Flavobacterium yafengii]MDI6033236.1 hypothetical protein [Flavobacterium yafengii]
MESTDTNAHNGIGANHIFDFKIICILDFQVIHSMINIVLFSAK